MLCLLGSIGQCVFRFWTSKFLIFFPRFPPIFLARLPEKGKINHSYYQQIIKHVSLVFQKYSKISKKSQSLHNVRNNLIPNKLLRNILHSLTVDIYKKFPRPKSLSCIVVSIIPKLCPVFTKRLLKHNGYMFWEITQTLRECLFGKCPWPLCNLYFTVENPIPWTP